MLKDSAYIQEKDVEFVNKRHKKKGFPPVRPLYTQDDVADTMALFQARPYSEMFDVVDGVQCRFEDAGHILGSASVSLPIRSNGFRTTLAYSGDLGRPRLPILRDPVLIGDDQTEYLICESTYGGRSHEPVEHMGDHLLQPILRAMERKGKIVIPAFSVGRTQEIVYILHQLSISGRLGRIPVYVDSPLSVNVTDVFRKHPECFDEETLAVLNAPDHNDPFGFDRLTYVRTLDESKALNETPGPFLYSIRHVRSGRVLHHLANTVRIPQHDPYCRLSGGEHTG
jgi:metallo-beta-lactamase family protein